MRAFLVIYFLYGCWVAGVAIGGSAVQCPNDIPDINLDKMATAVVFWPAYFAAAASTPRGFKFAQAPCKGEQK